MFNGKKQESKWYCVVSTSSANGLNAPSANGFIAGPFDTLDEAKKKYHFSWDAYGEQVVSYFRGIIEEEVY